MSTAAQVEISAIGSRSRSGLRSLPPAAAGEPLRERLLTVPLDAVRVIATAITPVSLVVWAAVRPDRRYR
jgi:hypothetical protein